MKKILITLGVLCFLVISGCGAKSQYTATLQSPDKFTIGQEVPLTLVVKKDDQPATGLAVTAHLEMKKMDHGSVDVSFTEKGNGEYVANTKIPMGGEWVAYTKLNDEEHEINFSIEGVE